MEIEEIEGPEPNPREILLDMERVTICGSDLHKYRGRQPCDEFPLRPGKPAHECLGRVRDPGPSSDITKGDLVLVRPPHADGLRETMSVPPHSIIPLINQDMNTDMAVMAQLVTPPIHCCRRLENVMGKSTFIIGQGPAGLTLASLLRQMGASPLFASEPLEYRRRESERICDRCLSPGKNLVREALEANDGLGYELVIEAVGKPDTIALAPRLAGDGGTVMLYGLPGEKASMKPLEFFSKQLRLTTTEGPTKSDFILAQEIIDQGIVDVERMITHRLPFREAPLGFSLADSKAQEVLRVILEFEN